MSTEFSLGGLIAAQILGQNYPNLVRKIIIVGAAPQGCLKVLEGLQTLLEKQCKEPA